MISAELILDADVLDAVKTGLQNAPKTMATLVNRSLLPTISRRALEVLQTPPGKVVYPIAWTSERQRRAFFATDGFGAGIPYRRTGALPAAWRVTFTPISDDGGAIMAENASPYAPFVIGNWQQRFHRNTGWYVSDDKIVELSEYANDALIDGWYSVASFEYP